MENDWGIPETEIRQILVIIEELFSNIVRYAFEDSLKHHVDIRIQNTGDHLEIEMIDDGIDFNPLEYQKAPSSDPVRFSAGGMGLTLIKAFASSISYRRIAGKNHIFITKKVKSK
jgi:serine/threonine-protein kinase RsbW